ncbi:MAG: DUF58 domain-containing protein [Planctomycetota bacterium]|nr:DUF58 domain-containing protein [Planctomycetota bacterium]
MADSNRSLIDPQTLMRIKSLEMRAKKIVEGLSGGLNRSPFHGFSVEFTEYRQYTPGDDPRYMDWKLFARSDRYFIKRFEDETSLRCHLILDMSRSMSFGSLGYSKIDYARTLAATLSYFLTSQRDAVGLVTFDEDVNEFVRARYRSGHFRRLMVALERATGGTSTSLERPLDQVAERVRRRGLLVLISDMLAPIESLQQHLAWLSARGQEVLLFQVLDPAELQFDFDQPALFTDLESGRDMYVDPRTARSGYQSKLTAHLDAIRESCGRLGIEHLLISTNEPLERVLSDFIRARMHAKKSGAGGRTSRPNASQRRVA